MTIYPEEHDFIAQVCAEDAAERLPRRLSDDPAVRLAECRGHACRVDESCGLATAFDEDAERMKFEALCERKGLEYNRYTEYAGWESGKYTSYERENQWQGWLACARQKAEEGK